MGSVGSVVAISAFAVGCGKPAARLQGDVAITLGDCAAPTVSFVSGPRPQPLEDDDPPPPIGAPADDNMFGGLLGNEADEMTGGWDGVSGYGPGSGPRVDPVGSGRYGGMRGRKANLPTTSLGQPNAQGDLPKPIIRRYIKRNINKIKYCYEKELLAQPTLAGTVLVQFLIARDGLVTSMNASGVDPNVASCVAAVIKSIEFPKPNNGGLTQVNYPFTFRPAEGAPPPRTAPDEDSMTLADGNRNRAEVRYKMMMNQTDPQFARSQKIEQARDAKLAARAYRPGAQSPLQAVQKELVACFRLQTKRHGVAVFDLASDKLTSHGIDHAGFKTCVGKLAKKLARTDRTSLRCSAAFGSMPVAEAPGIDITANAIMFDGNQVSEPATVIANPEPTWKIESLYQRADERVKALGSSTSPVTLYGPLIIRPIDATPMKVVTNVIASLRVAEDDAVLAAQRAGQWQLLRPIELPVVPVPVGTGAAWEPEVQNVWVEHDEKLSILVANDTVWFGISRVNDIKKVDIGDTAAIEATLKDYKAMSFFAERTDIEIAGDDDVSYGKVVPIIDLATKHGFVRWSVRPPQALSTSFQQ